MMGVFRNEMPPPNLGVDLTHGDASMPYLDDDSCRMASVCWAQLRVCPFKTLRRPAPSAEVGPC